MRGRAPLPVLPVLLAAVAGCGAGDDRGTPDPTLGALAVVDVSGLGVLPRSPWIEGRDGGPSGIAFGLSVWTYGDTVLTRADAGGSTWHTNSFDLRDPAAWRDRFSSPVDAAGAPAFFIPLTDAEQEWNRRHGPEECAEAPCGASWALWPGAPIADPTTGRVWVLYGLYNDARPSGIGIASWDAVDEPVVRRRVGDSWLLFPKPEPEWANAPVAHDGHLYAFGCVLDFVAHRCMLGRVPLASPDDPSAWRFFDGERWSADVDEARVLFEGAPIMHVSRVRALDRWLLVYSKPFEHAVVARIAHRIEGPWSGEVTLFGAPGEAPYDAVHHPELEEDDGLVQYVTYSRPRGDGSWFGSEHEVWRVILALE